MKINGGRCTPEIGTEIVVEPRFRRIVEPTTRLALIAYGPLASLQLYRRNPDGAPLYKIAFFLGRSLKFRMAA
jgi:hypothetical protein